MKIQEAYNIWAAQYDTNINKTRDLEAVALKNCLNNLKFESCLEIGCGTGKNTEWLLSKSKEITAVDLSEEMLTKAKNKINSDKVKFVQADINEDWGFVKNKRFDLITFSLVLEHIENLENIFTQLKKVVAENGYVYIGELHPFKQYNGSKARFETEGGLQIVNCFTHNISDFLNAAKSNGFKLIELNEHFDDNNRNEIPRILTLLLGKDI
jgi:2-polyprenyl-3-methyl-5-hydroxy-6-metoxy-1,4-benzoquinol methylase